MTARIPVYGLPWHLDQSPALRELLISPLSPYMQFEQLGWDGASDLPNFQTDWLRSNPIIFFQSPPPESLFNFPDARIIWIPMWDQALGFDPGLWQRFPKNLRVISFSNEISRRTRALGLDTLDVRYSVSPADCEQASWSKQPTLFYWNRRGMVGEKFLRKLCRELDVEVLLFRRRIDPAFSMYDYGLPPQLGKTIVQELTFEDADAHQKYLKHLNQANIFIAPRTSEGVGLSFIEALARGCAVFAYDAPTMNEYIVHKKNGYLLQHHYKSVFNTIHTQLRRVARRLGPQNPAFIRPITEWQNWAEIKKLDLQALGNRARQEQLVEYTAWKNILPQYASFILDW